MIDDVVDRSLVYPHWMKKLDSYYDLHVILIGDEALAWSFEW
jgi:hypothetical protein